MTMKPLAVGMGLKMSQKGIVSPDPENSPLMEQSLRPVARPRDTFCGYTAALKMIDEEVVSGCPGVSVSAMILDDEISRLDEQRKRQHDCIEKQRQEQA